VRSLGPGRAVSQMRACFEPYAAVMPARSDTGVRRRSQKDISINDAKEVALIAAWSPLITDEVKR